MTDQRIAERTSPVREDTSSAPSQSKVLLLLRLKAVGRRIGSAIIVLWGAATLTFAALQFAPGDVVDILAGENATDQVRSALAAQWGLDQPVFKQYLDYLWRLLHGDLGISYVHKQPVSELLGQQIGPTVELAIAAILIAVIGATVLSVVTSGRARGPALVSSVFELLAVSVPVFWWGIVLLIIFSFNLRWFPVAGSGNFSTLVLPAVTLAIPSLGLLTQIMRTSITNALEQPFATTVRARGVSEVLLRLRHGLKHATVSSMTLAGWLLGGLLGGAVITEQVFGRAGLGTATLSAVTNKDVPVVMAIVLLVAVIYVLVSTAVDIIAILIDPRIGAAS